MNAMGLNLIAISYITDHVFKTLQQLIIFTQDSSNSSVSYRIKKPKSNNKNWEMMEKKVVAEKGFLFI